MSKKNDATIKPKKPARPVQPSEPLIETTGEEEIVTVEPTGPEDREPDTMTVYKIRRKSDRMYKVHAGANKDYDKRGNSYSSDYSANAAILNSARTIPHPNKDDFINNHEIVEFELTEKGCQDVSPRKEHVFRN